MKLKLTASKAYADMQEEGEENTPAIDLPSGSPKKQKHSGVPPSNQEQKVQGLEQLFD